MRNIYKYIIVLGFFLTIPSFYLFAQVGINADNSLPNSSAMLDVQSSNMGFLFPRLSDAARNSIPSPGTALVIYNTTTNLLNYFNGSEWQQVSISISSTTTGSLRPGGGVSINTNPATAPDSSAMLDVNNPSRGIRIPRTNPDLITTPSTGLIVYNTLTNLINYYNGSAWRELCAISTGISGGTGNQSALGVSINSNGTTIHPSAILEISALDKGILIPRLTASQRSGLSPVAGLTIYNLNSNEIEFYNGSGWYKLNVSACAMSCPGTPTVIYGGQVYNTVQIGTQCWFKENLNIGIRINSVQEQTNNGIIEKYCYNDLESNCTIYGGLYQWHELMGYVNTAGVQAICPQGWHVSTDAEWSTLSTFLGGDWVAGGKIKSTGTIEDSTGIWFSPNTGATNETGFTGLPSGFRDNVGATYNGSISGAWWTSSQYNDSFAWRWLTSSEDSYLVSGNRIELNGYPVRCVKTTCSSAPLTPTSGTHSPLENLIIWNWIAVTNATGYKWSSVNNFANATEMGTATSWSEIGLTCNTPYTRYVWAYNACGNSTPVVLYENTLVCGIVGLPCPEMPTVIYGNQVYNTVQIGTQCWFKENLNIRTRIDGMQEQTDNWLIEKYCYEDLESNCDIYGGLYQWNEAMQYEFAEGSQGLCPNGWHIPTDAQWTALSTFLGGDSLAGGKMKSTGNLWDGTGMWEYPNYGATNESGFTGVPGGARSGFGNFFFYGWYGWWWSSSEDFNNWGSFTRELRYNESYVTISSWEKNNGMSVRCLKDQCSSAPASPNETWHVPSQTQIIWNWYAVTDAVGYKWNTANNYANAIDVGSAISHTQTGLICNNAYTCYVWAYNACGYSFPINMNQTTLACGPMGVPCPGISTVNYGGQTYNTVQIGTQCWLKENLNIGIMISGAMDQTNNSVVEKYCYNNDNSNCAIYGGLYQWNEMMQYITTAGAQGICPSGWHIPTDSQWTTVTTFLGWEVVAGGKMKTTGTIETGTGLWYSPNTSATNESGFSAVPADHRNTDGTFYVIGDSGYWWSSNEYNTSNAQNRIIYSSYGYIFSYSYNKSYGFSVRCLRD